MVSDFTLTEYVPPVPSNEYLPLIDQMMEKGLAATFTVEDDKLDSTIKKMQLAAQARGKSLRRQILDNDPKTHSTRVQVRLTARITRGRREKD